MESVQTNESSSHVEDENRQPDSKKQMIIGMAIKVRERLKQVVDTVKGMEIPEQEIMNRYKLPFQNWIKHSILPRKMSKVITNIGLGVGFVFATVGLIATVHLIVTLIITSSGYRTSSLINHPQYGQTDCQEGEDCPWNQVFSELSDKLLYLEMAFKDHASARENIEGAINNQSNATSFATSRLADILMRIENLTSNYETMDKRLNSLSRRLFSDEIIGFILFIIVLVEFITQVRPHVRPLIDLAKTKLATLKAKKAHMNGAVVANGGPVSEDEQEVDRPADETETIVRKEEKRVMFQQTNSPNISMIPKLWSLKNEVCVVLFRHENIPVYNYVVEAMLNQFYDVKRAAISHPYFMVESQKDINLLPHVKLFIVICNSHGNHGNANGGRDLLAVSLKIMKRMGATIVVIIGNDEGSIKLPSHTLYNTNLHLINSIDLMQELAYNNLVFSVQHEMSSFHQASHLRKTIKTVLNARLNAQCRHLLKNE